MKNLNQKFYRDMSESMTVLTNDSTTLEEQDKDFDQLLERMINTIIKDEYVND